MHPGILGAQVAAVRASALPEGDAARKLERDARSVSVAAGAGPMKKSATIDAMPEFRGFSLSASNRMIEANALRARGDDFESAIAFAAASWPIKEGNSAKGTA